MQVVTKCFFSLSPTDHLPAFSNYQPSELCQLEATFFLAKDNTLDQCFSTWAQGPFKVGLELAQDKYADYEIDKAKERSHFEKKVKFRIKNAPKPLKFYIASNVGMC